LADKIVVGITNPINMETYEPVVPAEGSSAAELARCAAILSGAQGVQHQLCADTERAEGGTSDHHGLGRGR
jgi:predicted dinucleotide-binding enzyme